MVHAGFVEGAGCRLSMQNDSLIVFGAVYQPARHSIPRGCLFMSL